MDDTMWHLFTPVPLLWKRRSAAAMLGYFLIFALIYAMNANRLPDAPFYGPYLYACFLGAPMWILSIATSWRRTMTWFAWGLHLLAALVIACMLRTLCGFRAGAAPQAEINAGIFIMLMYYGAFAIVISTILLGWGVDWLIQGRVKRGIP